MHLAGDLVFLLLVTEAGGEWVEDEDVDVLFVDVEDELELESGEIRS